MITAIIFKWQLKYFLPHFRKNEGRVQIIALFVTYYNINIFYNKR